MRISEIDQIEQLKHFTDAEIFNEAKFGFYERESKTNCLVYKIKIGKMIFTVDVTPVDDLLTVDVVARQKIGNELVKKVLRILRIRSKALVH